jgi:hypothetical protein
MHDARPRYGTARTFAADPPTAHSFHALTLSRVTLDDLMVHVRQFARGEIDLAGLQARLTPVLTADPLDVEQSEASPWEHAADESRLFWRVVYLFETGTQEEELRSFAGRLVACLESTRDAGIAYELLPLVLDADRLSTIVEKHLAGVISRTGFLNVVIESGYAPHAKLWLEHAPPAALRRLVEWLSTGAYRDLARALERSPT